MKRQVLTLSALCLLAASCTKKNSKLEYGLDVKETLRINLQVEPPTLDWSKSTDTTSGMVQVNIMDGLLEYDLKNPELPLVAGLATEWKPSENGRIWTFTLRKASSGRMGSSSPGKT
ncbi:MAG: hypothetical protein HC902_07485 [Calothrix sp. SM1_5_4]|nr:hypothetical protein [Calothrix sp. SM1_5_4]